MGRYYWNRKNTVEECKVLSLSKLRKWGLLGGYHVTEVSWTHNLSGRKTSVGLTIDTTKSLYIRFKYIITNDEGTGMFA